MGQSAEFGQFLRVMRARMQPEAAGLPTTAGARRVPGLRREEVAQLAGVSTDYYTRLEQGRQIRPSQSVVDAVARALQLDATERAHMLDLLHNCPPKSKSPAPVQRVRPGLWQLLDAIGDTPAMVLGRRTDVLLSNRMANLLFTAFSDLPVRERNLSRWIILEPAARELFRDWKTVAAETVGALRVDVGRHPSDPQANQLVGELAVTSEHFRQTRLPLARRPAFVEQLGPQRVRRRQPAGRGREHRCISDGDHTNLTVSRDHNPEQQPRQRSEEDL